MFQENKLYVDAIISRLLTKKNEGKAKHGG